MVRVLVHSTREQWLESATVALRPLLRKHAGLSVPRVRLSCGVHSQRRRGEVYIGKTVDDVAELNLSLLHTAEASSVLGTLMRLCIYRRKVRRVHPHRRRLSRRRSPGMGRGAVGLPVTTHAVHRLCCRVAIGGRAEGLDIQGDAVGAELRLRFRQRAEHGDRAACIGGQLRRAPVHREGGSRQRMSGPSTMSHPALWTCPACGRPLTVALNPEGGEAGAHRRTGSPVRPSRPGKRARSS